MRSAVPADAPIIAAHRYPQDADRAERAPYAAWVAGAMRRGLYLGFVMEQEGAVVAGAGLTLLEWGPSRHDPQPWRARLVNVWTHPDWRRQGHARALVQACLAAARARGITRISLGTTDMAQELYQGLGFTESGREMLLVQGGPTAD